MPRPRQAHVKVPSRPLADPDPRPHAGVVRHPCVTVQNVIAAVLALALFGCLFLALVRPERF